MSASERNGSALGGHFLGAEPGGIIDQRIYRFLEHAFLVADMTSGALISSNFFKRLLRLMTRR